MHNAILLTKPALLFSQLLENPMILLPGIDHRIRFKTAGLKDFLEANGLTAGELSKALDLSHR